MLACTERQFVRTYPAGTKIESSNYDPIPLWNHGIQMVALNVQTPGKWLVLDGYSFLFIIINLSGQHMYLNQGKFRQNGGCGYILKPKIMRNLDKNGTHSYCLFNYLLAILSVSNVVMCYSIYSKYDKVTWCS